ncbi:MAG: SEC-C metal-binding domain-containing protein [Verrucomicrobia bacterium]|nr:SEC-C metal-binding domain-containing protein [Verrucomicrobiota bacterium]
MHQALIKRARETKFFRAALIELASELPEADSELDAALEEAVAKRENEAFTHLLFAALGTGRSVAARHLTDGAALLPDPGCLAAVAMHISGDVAQALIDAVIGGKMGEEREAIALLLAGVWCKEKANVPAPPGLIAQARTLARRIDDRILPNVSLLALANYLPDEGLLSVLHAPQSGQPDPGADYFRREMINAVRDSVLGMVPENPPPLTHSGFTLRRAAARVGRNDPCPCGSGQKYKKCCIEKDQERLHASSSAPGMTKEELREHKELLLTEDELIQMRSYELARLDPAKVSVSLLPILITRLNLFRETEIVVGFFEKTGARHELEIYWDDTVFHACRAGRKDLLVRLLKVRSGSDVNLENLPFIARLMLFEESATAAIECVERESLTALKSPNDCLATDVAYTLLESRYPALGILVARGVLATTNMIDVDTLFEVLLAARDRLNLSPVDPFQRIVDDRFEKSVDAHRESAALQNALKTLDNKDRQLSQSRTELAELHAELERKEKEIRRNAAIHPEAKPIQEARVATGEIDELRRRSAMLKEDLKHRHNERNELRRNLQSALRDLEELRQNAAKSKESLEKPSEQAEENLLIEETGLGIQPVRIPEFPRKFLESIESLPPIAVRNAIALIGRLAAGDETAFAGVKRLKANRDVYRQRIGADYRLLFRLLPARFEIVALINRRDLDRKIESLI